VQIFPPKEHGLVVLCLRGASPVAVDGDGFLACRLVFDMAQRLFRFRALAVQGVRILAVSAG